MKILLVGGANQGKRDYAAKQYKMDKADAEAATILQLHLQVRQLMQEGKYVESEILSEVWAKQNWLVICDEIGSGIVPVDKFSREWQEHTGRLCCKLAEKADIVERIVCGIPQRLKG